MRVRVSLFFFSFIFCVCVGNEKKVCELRRKRQPPRHGKRKGEAESDSESESDEVLGGRGPLLVMSLPMHLEKIKQQ